ncbi:MAG: iron-containing alcohol dehydrogenase [Alphaproteobacteria bacterium]|nr:iron-containing alcohol dehydrogenase [Alphaproteobacteria bacterium]
MQNFTLSAIPEIVFGAGRIADLAAKAEALAGRRSNVLLITDPVLAGLGITGRAIDILGSVGIEAVVFDGLRGEPRQADIDAAASIAREAESAAVIGMGGGSALDIAKLVASCAVSGENAAAYALCATALPAARLPIIAVPTTAGTGSEVTRVSVFANADKAKVWAWGAELKPDVAILDPELTVAVPPHITAATGLDALVHAIEACTNKNRTDGNDLYCLEAIRLISRNLERAVKDPGDLKARGAMLLGSCYGGIGIDNAGTALAHNISHAIADLAPIPHGRATGLAMLATIGWVAEGIPLAFGRVARAMQAETAAAGYERLVRVTGIKMSFDGDGLDLDDPVRLAERMAAPSNTPMREATVRTPTDDDLVMLASRVLALQ